MPKRKLPPEKRTWARLVHQEWQLNLVSGEVLVPVRELSASEARQLSRTLPVFYFGFGMPVRDLTGDSGAIEAELNLTRNDVRGPEWNYLALYRGPRGTEAVVIDHQH